MNVKRTLVASLLAAGTAPAFAAGLACTNDSIGVLERADLSISQIETVAAGEDFAVDHCRILGAAHARTGADGKDYQISFELRLPNDWNQRFVHQFNGGNDGSVVPAVGELKGGDESDTALNRGYAVVSSDAGHAGDANPEAGLAGGARFGFDPEARRDYGYTAVSKLHPLATTLVETYYDDGIDYTYGVGGSNGGRHAMVAASRMPEAFDGLLVGYPGFNLPRAAVQHAWDIQAFKAINGDVRTAFSREQLKAVADGIAQACDSLDGLEDGYIADTDACQSAFDIEALQCDAAITGHCLSKAQVAALTAIHNGPVNSQGVPLYSDWPWDIGIGSGDWRFWKLETPIPPWNNQPLIGVMGSASLAQLFTTPPTEVAGTPQALEQYLLGFDFDSDAPKIYATTDRYPESAMDYMTPPDSENPTLADFNDQGGKMLIFHGVSDPVFSVNDTTNWYRKLDANNNDEAEVFARYYRVPGMPHGAGGPTVDDFDFFTALVDWVEQGKAPEAVVAGVMPGNDDAMAQLGQVERKLCPYPQVARYTGGDEASAASFACEE
ncbi:tannase/feruloyl esterase family alpha/beta hydrolase [Saccharospirillum alexandrii]|uniref:tannase/feruloyl esterase family alpha/beta hydrolase n=1 Tax=Saccharospirillum alexandrii TaxID=2448477 RepID=UPI000FDB8D5F|nr:tannase/feruloyl esterase family alpha/beta hydrolase [Saccharospirillum alexandrii]